MLADNGCIGPFFAHKRTVEQDLDDPKTAAERIVKNHAVTAITVEVIQIRVFQLSNLSKEQEEYALNATAPDPFLSAARQAIVDTGFSITVTFGHACITHLLPHKRG